MRNKNRYKINQRKKTKVNKRLLYVFSGLIVCLLFIAALEAADITSFTGSEKANSGIIPSDQPSDGNDEIESSLEENSSTNNDQAQTAEEETKNIAFSSGETLIEPFGNFVSNHNVILSDPASTPQQSICNTNPGAECYIKFTQGSVVRELEKQTTNNNGVATWVWDVKKSGLTTGEWQVSAVATLSGQEKSTNDSIKLEVKQ